MRVFQNLPSEEGPQGLAATLARPRAASKAATPSLHALSRPAHLNALFNLASILTRLCKAARTQAKQHQRKQHPQDTVLRRGLTRPLRCLSLSRRSVASLSPSPTLSPTLTQRTMTTSNPSARLRYITSAQAASLDAALMGPTYGYALPQLMELAGLACARCVWRCYPVATHPCVLVACGPGNQGGDGLVAARWLRMWGYDVAVWYPKQGKGELFEVSCRRAQVEEERDGTLMCL